MRRDIFLFAVGLVLSAPAGAASNRQDPDAIVARAYRALASLSSLQADFVQRAANRILEKTEFGHGTLYYRAPGRYRI